MIRSAYRRLLAAFAVALALGACSEPRTKPAVPPEEAAIPKLGVVGLVSELKERGMNRDNWTGVISGLFNQETDKNVLSTRYEVTVFYDDSTTGVIVVDKKPDYAPGQRVRVTGKVVEPVRK